MLKTSLNSLSGATENNFRDLLDNLNQAVEKLRSHQEDFESEKMIFKKVMAAPSTGGGERSRVKIHEPQAFDGNWDAKALQNFLFNVEQYFVAANIPVVGGAFKVRSRGRVKTTDL